MRFCPHCASPLVEQEVAGRVRKTCPQPQCDFVFWDNPLPVLAGIVERDGLVILARNQAWPEKMFGLITGFMERDETPEEGVAREIREELGLETSATHLVGIYPFPRKNELIIAYHCVARGEIILNEELAEYRLVAPERLRPWESGTGQALRDWLAGRRG